MNAHSPASSRTIRALVYLALLALICCVTGCSSSQHSTDQTTFTRAGDRVQVEVLLDEYKIHMPTTIPAGHVVFQIRNTGKHEHSIEITGQGVQAALPTNLKPGETTELSIDIKPGIYKVDCPVGPHSALGMRLELTVTQ